MFRFLYMQSRHLDTGRRVRGDRRGMRSRALREMFHQHQLQQFMHADSDNTGQSR